MWEPVKGNGIEGGMFGRYLSFLAVLMLQGWAYVKTVDAMGCKGTSLCRSFMY